MGRCYEYIKGAHHRDDVVSLTNKEIYKIGFSAEISGGGSCYFGFLGKPRGFGFVQPV